MSRINVGKVAPIPQGTWVQSNSYEKLNMVNKSGVLYIAKQDVPANTAITNEDYWMPASGGLTIGTVETVSASTGASATITQGEDSPVLNLSIPRGITGNESIDDNAGEGDTDKVWSADKTKNEIDTKTSVITSSVSGSLVTITDASELPVESLIAHIEPVQEGSGDPSPDNVRPIAGWTGVNVQRTGKNLVDWTGPETITSQTILYRLNTNQKAQYTASCNISNTGSINVILRFVIYNGNDIVVQKSVNATAGTTGRISATIDLGDTDFTQIRIVIAGSSAGYSAVCSDLQLELGSTATDYEPYSGDTLSVSWQTEAGEVYGGYVDVTKGKLVADRQKFVFNGSETWIQSGTKRVANLSLITVIQKNLNNTSIVNGDICNLYPQKTPNQTYLGNIGFSISPAGDLHVSDGTEMDVDTFKAKLANQNLVLILKLATPIEYDLTPQTLTTLLGLNNIWADTGDVDVTYRADTKMYVEESIEASESATHAMITESQESTATASKNYTAGKLIIQNDKLLRATANIASGGTITIGSNAEEVDLETLIEEKANQILVAKLPFLSSANLYNNIAAYHNAIPRHKDITLYHTDGTLQNRISGKNGYSLFDDIFVGDYITVGGQTYIVVDCDYYIRCGDGMDITTHHLVMMPQGNMNIPEGTALYKTDAELPTETLTLINTANASEAAGEAVTVSSQETAVYKKWNATMGAPNTNSTNGGYKYSRMRQIIMKAADTLIVNNFGAQYIKPIPVIYPNPANAEASGLASAWAWFKDDDWSSDTRRSICDLPNEVQIYGTQAFGLGSDWDKSGYEIGVDKFQFSLFRADRSWINLRASWWLRSVASATYAAYVNPVGADGSSGASYATGVRPRFLLFGS